MKQLLLLLCASFCFAYVAGNQITVTNSSYMFKFSQSSGGLTAWTAPATFRISSANYGKVPTNTASTLKISCAKEEMESFQIILDKTSSPSSVTVTVAGFAHLGATHTIDIGKAAFTAASTWATTGGLTVGDTTDVVANGGSVSLSSSVPTLLWFTLYVPAAGTTAGTTTGTITIVGGSTTLTLNVELYVFNFALDITPHFDTFMMSQPTRTVYQLDQMDAWKKVYLQHRMSYTDTAWPDGLNWQVAWDCTSKTLIDVNNATSNEQCIWANGCLANRYARGKGMWWKGVRYDDWLDNGFSTIMGVSTDGGRPDPFCSVACNTPSQYSAYSGWMCSTAYEAEWGKYLKAMQKYFADNGFYTENVAKGYWYTQNEPQNDHDYTISAYLCSMARTYAPGLPILLSREALPEIAEHPEYNMCGYDIWMAHVWRFTPAYTWMRQSVHGETSWFYSLDTDNICVQPGKCNTALAPAVSKTGNNGAMNPVALSEGPHYRLIPWVAWAQRITGWGYYHDDIFWDTRAALPAPARPRISAALLREGFEDYEYLYRANGNARPNVYTKNTVDDTVLSLGFAVGAWRNDPFAIHELRHQLGLYIEGTRADMPYLVQSPGRAFGNYYIDFGGSGTAPYTFNGVSWQPMGFTPYDVALGYGWNSVYMNMPNTIQTGANILHCVTANSGNLVEKTICYDDYNAPDEFHFQLHPGTYKVTVGVGWPGNCRGDPEYVSINNVILRNHQCGSNDCCNVRNYTQNVVVNTHSNGGDLVMTFGNHSGYTILSYLIIVGVSTSNCACTTGDCCDGCNLYTSSHVCRAAANDCDKPESCTGTSSTCPADQKKSDGTTCSSVTCSSTPTCQSGVCTCGSATCTCSTGDCCDGCHPYTSSHVCRAAVNDCDLAENCDGTNTACPADQKQPNGHTPCTGGSCVGGTNECESGTCSCLYSHSHSHSTTSHSCSCSTGDCCDGCHPYTSSHVCRAAANDCDVAENCDGSTTACPANQYVQDGESCSSTTCNGKDKCDGSGSCVCHEQTGGAAAIRNSGAVALAMLAAVVSVLLAF